MANVEVLLPAAALVIALGTLLLVAGLRRDLRERAGDLDGDRLEAALNRTLEEIDFKNTVHDIESHAGELRDLHRDIEDMLRAPTERGAFGEQQLEVLLSDHLPPEMYGVREQVVEGKAPDAHVRSSAGLICVDAKFPLDNYEKYVRADDAEEAQRYRRQFARDVETQLSKISDDYVRPEAGTADFAFAFVPAESVYYHLVTEEYELLRSYTAKGVQVVSPLTFGHKLELIKADVDARRLTEQAEEVRRRLQALSAGFERVEDEWETLFRHVRNAEKKARDVETAYDALRAEFERIERPVVEHEERDRRERSSNRASGE
jgi:DNA recombination protein RmuC